MVSIEHDDVPFEDVHSYIVSFNPGTKRAMHYHKNKKEWLTIASGEVKVYLEDVESGEEETKILSENDKLQEIIYLPPKVAHVIKNIGEKEACVIVFSKSPEMPEDTLKYEMDV